MFYKQNQFIFKTHEFFGAGTKFGRFSCALAEDRGPRTRDQDDDDGDDDDDDAGK